ncbi:YrrS family protein [Marinilactibacillus psychrotolerans]|uniref:YrrS family protein n=1 Tax=Marinilactibacillus psychrotolerans TaxID=191770 RepID=UPI003887194A
MKRNHSKQSRSEKKTSGNKFDKIYYVVITILVFILLALLTYVFIIRDNDSNQISKNISPNTERNSKPGQDTSKENEQTPTEDAIQEKTSEADSEDPEADESPTEEKNDSEVSNVEEAESDDPLVERAYTGKWTPIGTEQSGEHVTNFNEGSQDRVEINQAVTSVTGLDSGNIIEWWIAGDGPNRVEATVSNENKTEVYRVYLQFIKEEGWQPTRVEELSKVPAEYQ